RMKSAFLGMAAHELNTPLTTIIGFTELLTVEETAKNFDQKQKTEYLQLIHDKALALGGLIDDLLDISRVESGRALTICYEEFDLKEKISTVIQPYQNVAGD
ncbi:MAG: PAS domain-containing sensor histidine kinase, partial [Phycisphaerae bacterium]|nr:HAMP domain-containing histidine kinase [candidate division Zixibacteria bacterium]NIP50345.1 HAMP domain-containing histidine kinase [Gammaproteobacteria bacterium]NIR51537.1 HAMP domain-containing histidine kinase [candidate division KSB1 bacterium]NIV02093.1 PAS domain-containing sensor histidine kinase [Phycisphaerae bacterium]NIR66455.1 HAMP domain-containing histidine kinase [candidate division Zixibacteria bacterium]